MTISEQESRNSYTGNGVNDTFAFTFRILANSDLLVNVSAVRQIEGANYDLVNVTESGGDVVFRAGSIPADGAPVDLVRDTPIDQNIDYNPYDPFPAETHELALDKLTMISQELRELITLAEFGDGLPLDPSGNFWNAASLRIKNVTNPADGGDAATKAYVDQQVGNPFNPADDAVITGVWSFTQTIGGVTSGNLVAADIANFGDITQPVLVTGAWTFVDGAGSPRKPGARNPRTRPVLADDVPTQADEGAILRIDSSINTITLEQLEADTAFTILAKASGFTLVEGTNVEINSFNAAGIAPAIGDRTVGRGTVMQVQYQAPGIVNVWDNWEEV